MKYRGNKRTHGGETKTPGRPTIEEKSGKNIREV